MNKFKVGDKVRCKDTYFIRDSSFFKPGYEFYITEIKVCRNNSDGDSYYLYNGNSSSCGDTDVERLICNNPNSKIVVYNKT
ncbi:hypothetical protein LCGC14_2233760 [marine sediment metagenome]|uniref:Uncharacterized protein n=1 Tax=marine sediment metagenome TaxID=412755 RepID=A0A0F9FJZ3_9ZZZZ